ncbi:YopX family protein [Hyphomicrobium sp.]|uniref:YopX family protein n=1 Tax=Hyphomicrobium sp. TaxID=82 RepID=UPI002FDF1A3B
MREIKFRQFCSDENSYQYGMHFYDPHQRTLVRDGNWHTMQFTGLKDKAGNDVYEGDIVRAVDRGDWRNAEIAWGMCGFFIRLKHAPHIWYLCKGRDGTDMHLEVIGNIYENPELLA